MSSGLIPITNGVTAIPEFVDEKCGVLAASENAHELAQGIEKIYQNPELFQKMSEAASKRVRNQCGFEHTIGRELELFYQQKVLIFGSCVSRDIFNLENNFKIQNYFARSSFASIFQEPFIDSSIVEEIESKFQKNIVKADMEKSILLEFQKDNFDILLIDFIDERFSLLSIDNTLCTLSNEAISTGILKKYNNNRVINSDTEEFYKMWVDGWRKFIKIMKENGQLEKVVLNKVYWAETTISGVNFEPTYQKNKIDKMNDFLNKLYLIAEKDVLPQNVIKHSKKVMVGADKHQWGLSPFHYIENYYQDSLEFLGNLDNS